MAAALPRPRPGCRYPDKRIPGRSQWDRHEGVYPFGVICQREGTFEYAGPFFLKAKDLDRAHALAQALVKDPRCFWLFPGEGWYVDQVFEDTPEAAAALGYTHTEVA